MSGKLFVYEVKKDGETLFTVKSDSLKYIRSKRNKELFDESGAIYTRYFNSEELINGEPADYYLFGSSIMDD